MSASKEKQKRRAQQETGTATKADKALEQKKKAHRKAWIYGGIAVVFVVVFLSLMVLNSNSYLEHKTAATVGDEKISVVDFNYYYKGQVNTYANYFGDSWSTYASMFTSDTFVSAALSSAQQTVILANAAKDAGCALTQDELDSISSTIAAYESYASYAGYSSTDGFIEANYGKGCSADSYQSWLEEQSLASSYATQLAESYSFTDQQKDDYYAAYKKDFDTVSYRYFFLSGAETDEMTAEEALDWATTTGEAMAQQAEGSESAFNDLCADNSADETTAQSYRDDGDYSLVSDAKYSQCGTNYADWLFDDARIEGETTAITTDSGCYVVYFVGRAVPDYNMRNVRHILISVDDTTDETAMAQALTQAQTLLDTYLAGDQTEDAFAQLATDNSSDSSASQGGLVENIYRGQMVADFEDWCFDDSRQSGDTGIVESTYGYHVMYYVGEGGDYLNYAVDQTLRSNEYSAWYTARQADYPTAQVASGLKRCDLTIVSQ